MSGSSSASPCENTSPLSSSRQELGYSLGQQRRGCMVAEGEVSVGVLDSVGNRSQDSCIMRASTDWRECLSHLLVFTKQTGQRCERFAPGLGRKSNSVISFRSSLYQKNHPKGSDGTIRSSLPQTGTQGQPRVVWLLPKSEGCQA